MAMTTNVLLNILRFTFRNTLLNYMLVLTPCLITYLS